MFNKKIFLLILLLLMLLCSCDNSYEYKKYNETNFIISDDIIQLFKNTNNSKIQWFLSASREWKYYNNKEGIAIGEKYSSNETYKPYTKITIYNTDPSDFCIYVPYDIIDTATTLETKIHLYKKKYVNTEIKGNDRIYSNLVIKLSDDFFIRIEEYSYNNERRLTTEAIEEVKKIFLSYDEQHELLQKDESLKIDHKNLLSIENRGALEQKISGYLHVEKKAHISIVVKDIISGTIVYNQKEEGENQYYVGWSSEINDFFYFEYEVPIKWGNIFVKDGEYEVQVWAENEKGNANCVISENLYIEFWER